MTAEDGARLIEWAGRSMPVLATIGDRLAQQHRLRGLCVGISLVLEPKTANLALTLAAAGAGVSVHCPGHSTTGDVARALEARGLAVFAEAGADEARDTELARGHLGTGPDILLDDGAAVIRLAHREFPDIVARMRGAAEETTSGVRPLMVMHEAGALQIPVIAVNDARTKYLFDNVYGTGQSCVMTLLDLTNLQLAGRRVVVVGYGWVGQGVARHAAALGARVTVSEIDAVRGLQALHDGHEVASLTDAAPYAEVVFAATGLSGAVTAEHVQRLPDGALLCTAGGGPFEMPMDYLHTLPGEHVRPAITQYQIPSGARVLVVSEGDCLNCTDAEGNPIEVMDLSLSLQALAAETLAGGAADWTPGVYPIRPQAETEVAAAQLRYQGGTLEPVTDQIAAAMREW